VWVAKTRKVRNHESCVAPAKRNGNRAFTATRLGLCELDIESDRNLVTNQNSAGLEGSIPGQAKVFSVDLCGRGDRNPGVTPWILGRWRWPFDRKADLAGNATDGQVAFDFQLSIPDDADALGFEMQGWKLLHIKEIGTLQVRIALFIAGVYRRRLDRGLDARVRKIKFVEKQSSRNFGELAFHIGDHHVLDFELGHGVSRVDVPGGG
jgi:hypothetical protein